MLKVVAELAVLIGADIEQFLFKAFRYVCEVFLDMCPILQSNFTTHSFFSPLAVSAMLLEN